MVLPGFIETDSQNLIFFRGMLFVIGGETGNKSVWFGTI